MSLHYVFVALLTVLVPLAAGIAIFKLMRRAIHWLPSLALALLTALVTWAFTSTEGMRCAESYEVTLAAPRWLSPTELRTLRGMEPKLCPAVYQFQRNGRLECIISDGHGKVLVGCGGS